MDSLREPTTPPHSAATTTARAGWGVACGLFIAGAVLYILGHDVSTLFFSGASVVAVVLILRERSSAPPRGASLVAVGLFVAGLVLALLLR